MAMCATAQRKMQKIQYTGVTRGINSINTCFRNTEELQPLQSHRSFSSSSNKSHSVYEGTCCDIIKCHSAHGLAAHPHHFCFPVSHSPMVTQPGAHSVPQVLSDRAVKEQMAKCLTAMITEYTISRDLDSNLL